MKICIVTGMYKRHPIFEMFARGVVALQKAFPQHEIICIVAGSEGQVSRQLVKKYGFIYNNIDNRPLSRKMQSTVDMAKTVNPDYVICTGSDDVMSVELFREYLTYMNKGIDYIGCEDWYFYDLELGKALYWGGYTEPHNIGILCGAGRCLSRGLLDKLDWIVWQGYDRILDTGMDKRLQQLTYSYHAINLRRTGLYGLDIKSSDNMTPFDLWRNSVLIDNDIILEKFAYVWN